jgi:hypothetical protein
MILKNIAKIINIKILFGIQIRIISKPINAEITHNNDPNKKPAIMENIVGILSNESNKRVPDK